jgi:uncharacterized membrane protein YfcA
MILLIIFFAAVWAGMQNALAGGGSFITIPLLIFSGMDAIAANITSTIALFPAQVASGLTGRQFVSGAAGLSFRNLTIISLIGGAIGAVLLLVTPPSFFERLIPWLVLFATISFALGSFRERRNSTQRLSRSGIAGVQFAIAIYGGFFGGGIGFLMYAALAAAGVGIRTAGATKNALAAVMNASAVAIFVFSPQVRWLSAAVYGGGAIIGGIVGSLIAQRVNERVLRVVVVVIGLALTVGLFVRGR